MHYTVADYLLDRLAQMGIRHMFGVPGDYNLLFLDHVISHRDITWVGCANELNAAYAADGYARTQSTAALLTTYGVGELSAINGIAGSYAEYLPVVHIVGSPTSVVQRGGELVHHSLGDGDFQHFQRMYQEITVAQAFLTVNNAQAEIDRVLAMALCHRRPVYLNLPSDVALLPVSPVCAPLIAQKATYSAVAFDEFMAAAEKMLISATSVSLLADFLVDRFQLKEEVQKIADTGYVAHSTLMLGKSILDETHPHFVGTYSGGASEPFTKEAIEQAEVILTVGVRLTDSATCGFTHTLHIDKSIDIQPFEARVGNAVYTQLPMRKAVEGLLALTIKYGAKWSKPPVFSPSLPGISKSPVLDQSAFWQRIQNFLRPDDVVIAEQGTACFGAITLRLPHRNTFVAQPLWGSIGYTLPAAFGIQTADPERRVIILIGDGSAQLTVQEIGSMLRDGLKPIIIVLNNEGYTIERAIHGAEQYYNNIAQWDWTKLPAAMGLGIPSLALQVSEAEQLAHTLERAAATDCLSLIEVILPKMDVPPFVASLTERLRLRNQS